MSSDPVMRDLARHESALDEEMFRECWKENWIEQRKDESSQLRVLAGIKFNCFGCNREIKPGSTLWVDQIDFEISCEDCLDSLADKEFEGRETCPF